MNEEQLRKQYWLRRYLRARAEFKRVEISYKELCMDIMPKGMIYTDMPKSHNVEHDLSDIIASINETYENYIKARYRQVIACKEVTDKIKTLTNEQQKDVLTCRYIKGMRWEDIESTLYLSNATIHRAHRKALNELII